MIGPIFIEMAKKLNAVNGFSEDVVVFVGDDTFTLLKKELITMAGVVPSMEFSEIKEATINTEFGKIRVMAAL